MAAPPQRFFLGAAVRDGRLGQGQRGLRHPGLGRGGGGGGGLHRRRVPRLRAGDAHHPVLTVAAVREPALGVDLPGVLLADRGMVLVVVLPDPPGTATEVGPAGAAAPDAVGGQLGDALAAGREGREVGVVLLGPHAPGQCEELQATVPGHPQPVGFLEMSLRQAAGDRHLAHPADDGVVVLEVDIQRSLGHGGWGRTGC